MNSGNHSAATSLGGLMVETGGGSLVDGQYSMNNAANKVCEIAMTLISDIFF
jgi:hypothetical protein